MSEQDTTRESFVPHARHVPMPTSGGIDLERQGNVLELGSTAAIRRLCGTVKGLFPHERIALSSLLWNSDDENAIMKFAKELSPQTSPIDMGGVRHFMRRFFRADFHIFVSPDSPVREFSIYSVVVPAVPDNDPGGAMITEIIKGEIDIHRGICRIISVGHQAIERGSDGDAQKAVGLDRRGVASPNLDDAWRDFRSELDFWLHYIAHFSCADPNDGLHHRASRPGAIPIRVMLARMSPMLDQLIASTGQLSAASHVGKCALLNRLESNSFTTLTLADWYVAVLDAISPIAWRSKTISGEDGEQGRVTSRVRRQGEATAASARFHGAICQRDDAALPANSLSSGILVLEAAGPTTLPIYVGLCDDGLATRSGVHLHASASFRTAPAAAPASLHLLGASFGDPAFDTATLADSTPVDGGTLPPSTSRQGQWSFCNSWPDIICGSAFANVGDKTSIIRLH